MKLLVKTNSRQFFTDPEGLKSSDRCAPVVKAFCQAHNLPYSDIFVSIAVLTDKKISPIKLIGERRAYNISDEFGKYAIELREEVIQDTQVVTIGDFQTVICKAIQIYCGDPYGHKLKRYLREILIDLREKPLSKKKDALRNASRQASNTAYAEARVFRHLRSDDKRPMPYS